MTARGQVITDNHHARSFSEEIGFPIVLKPLTGSGGLATWCIRTAAQLELALDLMQPSRKTPSLPKTTCAARSSASTQSR